MKEKFLFMLKKLSLVKECIESQQTPSKKNTTSFNHNLANIILFDINEFKTLVRVNLPEKINFDKKEVVSSINMYSTANVTDNKTKSYNTVSTEQIKTFTFENKKDKGVTYLSHGPQ